MQVTPSYHTFCQNTSSYIFSKVGRHIPIFLDEYNLAAYSSQQEMRVHEVFSVAFFASMHKHMVEGGCDWGASWNLWDQYYGLMNGSNFLLAPASQIFTLSNTYMKGLVYSSSSDDTMVEIFAVKSTTSKNVYVINKSNSVKSVTLTSSNGAFGSSGLTRITAGDSNTPISNSLPSAPVTISVLPYNVVLLIDANNYIGCIQDGNPSSLLIGPSQHDTAITPTRCQTFCSSSGYSYAGMSYTYCFCDNQYPAANIVSDSSCSQPCAGDSTKMCGGAAYHTSIYHS